MPKTNNKTFIPKTKKELISVNKDNRGRLAVVMRESNVWCGYDETFVLYFTADDLFKLKVEQAKRAFL
jgi:hypothetical protein